jgi:DNA-binding NtrC family response regulator
MIAAGTCREDLYFRINVIEVHVPPLRDRAEDSLVLAEHCLRLRDEAVTLDVAARRAILEYEWPGNVRELENRIERALLVRKGSVIAREEVGLGADAGAGSTRRTAPSVPDASSTPEDAGRAQVERALADAQGVVSRAAALLGLSRQALYWKMERLGIAMERKIRV